MLVLALLSILTLSVSVNTLEYSTSEFSVQFEGPKVWTLKISADRLSDGLFAYARIERTGQPSKLQVEVRVVDRKYGNSESYCSLDLAKQAISVKASVHWFQRISRENILLTWYDELNSGEQIARLVILNTTDCNLIAYELPVKHILVALENDGFDMIVADKATCKELGEVCRINYDQTINKFAQPQNFNVNLQWKSLVVKHAVGDNFFVRGFDAKGDYQIMLLNRSTGVSTKLTSLEYVNSRSEIMSSGLTVCWIANPGRDQLVNCIQFNEQSQVVFTKTLDYHEPVTLVSVENVSEGEIFLLVGIANCQDGECWNIANTVLKRETLYNKWRQLQCSGDRKQFGFFKVLVRIASDATLVEYSCESATGLFHAIHVV